MFCVFRGGERNQGVIGSVTSAGSQRPHPYPLPLSSSLLSLAPPLLLLSLLPSPCALE